MKVKSILTVLSLLLVCSIMLFAQQPPYQKIYPAPDTNKAGVPLATPAPTDLSCWQATAANMLAGAGYGNGATVQARAADIYAQMTAHYGLAGGWIDDALNWWLTSANNVWPNNPYDNVVTLGSYTRIPLNDPNLAMTIANELRSCNFVGLSISWPDAAGDVPGTGGHAITSWGDNIISPSPVPNNPQQVIITDSDANAGEDTYNYAQQNYLNTSTATNTSGLTLNNYPTTRIPFIKHYTVLSAQPAGTIARGTRTITQTEATNAIGLNFTAYQKEDWVHILSYRQTIDTPYTGVTVTESDHGLGDGERHAIAVVYTGLNVPQNTTVTIDVEFVLDSWNTVRFENVNFVYPDAGTIKALPNVGWIFRGIPRNIIPQLKSNGGDGEESPKCFIAMTDGDGVLPERGFMVASYDILNSIGQLVAVDKVVHEFDQQVEFNTHYLDITNDDTVPVRIRNVKMGFSEGYLTKAMLANFNNWSTIISGETTVPPGTTKTFTGTVYMPPQITSITPNSGLQGQTLTVTIAGSRFTPNSAVRFSGSGITVNSVNMVNSSSLQVGISIASTAAVGLRNLIVSNPGNRFAILRNAFTVVASQPTPAAPICGTEGVYIRDRANITSTGVASNSYVEMGADTVLNGSIMCSGNAFLRERARVNGKVSVTGDINKQNNVVITGGEDNNAVYPWITIPTQTCTPGTNNIVVNGNTTLSAGSYGSVTVNSGCTLTLNPGVYQVKDWIINPDATLVLKGPVQLKVANQFQINDRARLTGAATASDLQIYAQQSSQVRFGVQSQFMAKVVAPNAEVCIADRTSFSGSILAKRVEISADAKINAY